MILAQKEKREEVKGDTKKVPLMEQYTWEDEHQHEHQEIHWNNWSWAGE